MGTFANEPTSLKQSGTPADWQAARSEIRSNMSYWNGLVGMPSGSVGWTAAAAATVFYPGLYAHFSLTTTANAITSTSATVALTAPGAIETVVVEPVVVVFTAAAAAIVGNRQSGQEAGGYAESSPRQQDNSVHAVKDGTTRLRGCGKFYIIED